MVQIYKMHDSDPVNFPGVHRIHPDEAHAENKKGFGIFHTINQFNGRRQIQNLVKINSWAVDMDFGTKAEMMAKLKAGLTPSMVVETKRGYQSYWMAQDAQPKHWNAIVLDRLVPFYGADPKARDIARILRRPGFLHLKNPAEPFLIEKKWQWNVAYTERQMAYFYPDQGAPLRQETCARMKKEYQGESSDLWEAIWHLDCEDALSKIAGTEAVGGETFSFVPNASGTKNIFVDGKSTSCWIDISGRIGSLDRGGPTLWQWVNWYHRNHSKTARLLKTYFPELPWTK